MNQTQTTPKSSFLKAPYPLLVDTVAKTDAGFWQTPIKQTYRAESFETETLEKPEEWENNAASTRLSIAQDMEVRFNIEALFNSYADEQFEDGMDNEFVDELTALIVRYDKKAVNCIADGIATNRANPQVISEALRWLGQIRHPVSHRSRLSLLEGSLHSPSRWIRDGAALGLASMKDIHAVPYLREAIRKEQIPDLRDDLELVLDTLEQ